LAGFESGYGLRHDDATDARAVTDSAHSVARATDAAPAAAPQPVAADADPVTAGADSD
jgi:hypothetical protein